MNNTVKMSLILNVYPKTQIQSQSKQIWIVSYKRDISLVCLKNASWGHSRVFQDKLLLAFHDDKYCPRCLRFHTTSCPSMPDVWSCSNKPWNQYYLNISVAQFEQIAHFCHASGSLRSTDQIASILMYPLKMRFFKITSWYAFVFVDQVTNVIVFQAC